jgi:hypothetical protein
MPTCQQQQEARKLTRSGLTHSLAHIIFCFEVGRRRRSRRKDRKSIEEEYGVEALISA